MERRFTLDKLPARVLRELELETAFFASRLVVAAERLQVFRRLAGGRWRTARSLGRSVGIHARYAHRFFDALSAIGLLRKRGDTYANSRLAEKYFIEGRSIHWTRQYSAECAEDFLLLGLLEEVLQSGKDHCELIGEARRNYVDDMHANPQQALDFTRMLYHYHQPEAKALAAALDLSQCSALLDVGGGSGVMSIALVRKYPGLKACILDIEPVCRVTEQILAEEKLADRIAVRVGDMRKPLPRGFDVLLLCDVGRILPDVLRRAHEALPVGGRIILVERFVSPDGTRPLEKLLSQFVPASFGMETQEEARQLLAAAGFTKIRGHRVLGDVSALAGMKGN